MSEKESLTNQLESILTYYAKGEAETYLFARIDDAHIQIEDETYTLVADYREGFDLERFKDRYDEYFAKYDYIVGDWAADQLRLRGFYQLNRQKVPRNRTIDFLDDYLKEYCNFGCAYFVLAKQDVAATYPEELVTYYQRHQQQLERNEQKLGQVDKPRQKANIQTRSKQKSQSKQAVRTKRKHKGSFIIRKKEEA
ncbi:transcriptional regulator [Suicoccus acidiformans]|uniref:Transcriptional regulator n=1 Tax=Suicoccus acidiformans TaxID=2036206 RepID=A0A347WJJ3_9LACT|nr:YutD family protein [Suicoccus acidiformans]AXY25250.1 transcriptional regulator [Suicoccus acidiformans]